MNLKRQLLLVSLLTLILPWAGCEFISETESALRSGQQQMLAGTARAIAESLQQYADEFPAADGDADFLVGDQLYAHELVTEPTIDGYVNDWPLPGGSLQTLRGSEGNTQYVLGSRGSQLFLYLRVSDSEVVYGQPQQRRNRPPFSDGITLVSSNPPTLDERFEFAAEAPGIVVAWRRSGRELRQEPTIRAVWQDVPGGYQLEARIPRSVLGTHLGLVIHNTANSEQRPVRSASFSAREPGTLAGVTSNLESVAGQLVQPGMRLLLTDAAGWRISNVGELQASRPSAPDPVSAWLRFAYDALVEPGIDASFAEPHPTGREQQPYIQTALNGEQAAGWFRSPDSGTAIVSVAEPVTSNGQVIGTVILQQGTDEILSLRNQGLARLLNVTLISTAVVAVVLLGFATWLSRRIRRLSVAAGAAIDGDRVRHELPSADAKDEVGDLSRSFSNVLDQLGNYNDYLRTLASKLSHELRTPLALVTSSLDNLEHENLSDTAASYTARAKDGADRLRAILNAMSEASRVEELIKGAEVETFDLKRLLEQMRTAYADVYTARNFHLHCELDAAKTRGTAELIVQMLDKLIDNAVDFSEDGDVITIDLAANEHSLLLSVTNPGPKLPDAMRGQLFDSMVSVREKKDSAHLGLGLYVARLIAEGHGGSIRADNTENGVQFTVVLKSA